MIFVVLIRQIIVIWILQWWYNKLACKMATITISISILFLLIWVSYIEIQSYYEHITYNISLWILCDLCVTFSRAIVHESLIRIEGFLRQVRKLICTSLSLSKEYIIFLCTLSQISIISCIFVAVQIVMCDNFKSFPALFSKKDLLTWNFRICYLVISASVLNGIKVVSYRLLC